MTMTAITQFTPTTKYPGTKQFRSPEEVMQMLIDLRDTMFENRSTSHEAEIFFKINSCLFKSKHDKE